jgi:hypothetical protein
MQHLIRDHFWSSFFETPRRHIIVVEDLACRAAYEWLSPFHILLDVDLMNCQHRCAKAIRHQTTFDQSPHAHGGNSNRSFQHVIGILLGVRLRQRLSQMQNYSVALLGELVLPRVGLPLRRVYASQFERFIDPSSYILVLHRHFRSLIYATLHPIMIRRSQYCAGTSG